MEEQRQGDGATGRQGEETLDELLPPGSLDRLERDVYVGDTAKVLLRRVAGADHVQGFAYVKFNTPDDPHASGRSSYHHFGDDPGPFSVSADIAVAAVATGGFEVDPDSRVKLKKRGDTFVVDDEVAAVETSGEGE